MKGTVEEVCQGCRAEELVSEDAARSSRGSRPSSEPMKVTLQPHLGLPRLQLGPQRCVVGASCARRLRSFLPFPRWGSDYYTAASEAEQHDAMFENMLNVGYNMAVGIEGDREMA